MKIRRLLAVLVMGVMMAVHPAHAALEPSDINTSEKVYEFSRSYITALSYMKEIYDRWDKNAPKKLFADQKNKMILATIDDLSLDSSDLLIIKNYMAKYLVSPDELMRRVAAVVVVSTTKDIAINHKQKTLWQKWYGLNIAGQATRPKEIEFVKTQHGLELQRKEADKDIIQGSVLMTKILMSEKSRVGKEHLLLITAQQRQKLLDKLDSFGSDNLDWGLKSGQRTLEGSVAVIREILEDSLWTSIDEK